MSRDLPETFPHEWLPEKLELETWEQIEPWYQKLMELPTETGQTSSVAGRRRRVQRGRWRGWRPAPRRDDLPDRRPEREAAYLAYVRDIEPKLKPIQNAIRSRYLDAPDRSQLPRDRYFVFDRALENRT